LTNEEEQQWESRLLGGIQPNIDFIVNNLPDNGVLFDVGANTGLLSLEVLKRKPTTKLFLFEPIPEYFQSIENKFRDKDAVWMFRYALTDTIGVANISMDNNNRGYNTLSSIREYGSITTIDTADLSYFVDTYNLPIPDVMKIDVEESEYLVIEGYKKAMERGHLPKIIYMEIGIKAGYDLWDKEKQMIEYLFSSGYERFDYENNHYTYDAIFKLIK
jgi:FkbM family methyltransferase